MECAAAGNGKTYSICQKARIALRESNKKVLLISYTNEGLAALKCEYRKQNQGIIDDRIVIKSWYTFLLSDIIKPYQCSLKFRDENGNDENIEPNYIQGIDFSSDQKKRFFTKKQYQYYFSHRNVIANVASDLACKCNIDSNGQVIQRVENIYSHIFLDEVQDYVGWDLDLIKLLFQSKIFIYCVGDPRQNTFRTNNSTRNKKYQNGHIMDFFEDIKISEKCEVIYRKDTRRFNQEICNFVNEIYPKEELAIYSGINENTENSGVYILGEKEIELYCNLYCPVILRNRKDSKVKFRHNCNVFNWGAVKGRTYDRVVIIANSTVIKFLKGKDELKDITRARLYVACTRAKHSIVFYVKDAEEIDSFQKIKMNIGDQCIDAYKWQSNL